MVACELDAGALLGAELIGCMLEDVAIEETATEDTAVGTLLELAAGSLPTQPAKNAPSNGTAARAVN